MAHIPKTTPRKFPEHEKLQAISKESQSQGAFIEWLHDTKSLTLCKRPASGRILYHPEPIILRELLAEYHGINLEKLENEKDQMVALHSKLNEQ